MIFEKLDSISIKRGAKVRYKVAGDVLELLYKSKWGNGKCAIKKLSRDEYTLVSTGEIFEFNKIKDRSESKASLRRTFALIRDTINANIVDYSNIRWVTLTYAENMTDTKRLYKDLVNFRKKVKYHIGNFEYISIIEPQGRGAWHSHELWIFDKKAPYVDQEWLEREIWQNGYVKVKKLDSNCDNLGAYLTAYLGDIPLEEYDGFISSGMEIKTVQVEQNGSKVDKHIVKGGRLSMYPPGMQIFRASRGVKRATVEYTTYEEAQKKIGVAAPTFEKNFQLINDDFNAQFSYKYYNRKR